MIQRRKTHAKALREGRRNPALNRCFMAVLACSVALSCAPPVHAQQSTELRGTLSDTRPASAAAPPVAAGPEAEDGLAPRPYEPVSPGALETVDDSENLGLLGVPVEGVVPSGPADDSGGTEPRSTLPADDVATPAERPARRTEDAALDPVRENAPAEVEQPYLGAVEQDREANPAERRADRDNLPASAIERRVLRPDPQPFAPLGIRAGVVTLRPSISQGLRATTNADNSADGDSAVLSETRLRLRADTDWSRHSAWLDFDGTYDKSISGEEYSAPNAALRAGFQLDLGERTTVTGTAGYRYRQEDPSAPTAILGTSNRPGVQELDADLGVRHEFGKFFADVKGSVTRTTYGNAEFSDGTVISQKDRDNTFASIALRGGFEMSPAIKPFVEVEIGKLLYDESVDFNGYRRSGVRTALRGGVELDLGEKTSGEIAVGYLRQGIDDERLEDVDGLSVDAALKWSPQRGTDVDIGLLTRVEGATAPEDSGSIYYEGTVGVKRQVRANLDLNAKLIASLRDNRDGSGLDKGFGAEIGATYWFNRFTGLDVSARHQLNRSEVDSRRTDETSVYVGVTLQR